jgi:hypothetical protein
MASETDGLFGGRITFNAFGQYIPPAEGEFQLNPSLYKKEMMTNQDGSGAVKLTPKQPACKVKLRNVKAVDWQAIMLQTGNITIVEEDGGRTHLFTGSQFTGEPEINLTTGEVDGLTVEGGTYQKLGNS